MLYSIMKARDTMTNSFDLPQCEDFYSDGFTSKDVSELLNNSDSEVSDTLAGFLESQGVNVGELERIQDVIQSRADRRRGARS